MPFHDPSRTVRLRGPGPVTFVLVVLLSATPTRSRADGPPVPPQPDAAEIEFFEKSVRPILVQRCHGCHGAAKQKGRLRLDSRRAVLAGGSAGLAVVPGRPEDSLMVGAINYGDRLQMPPKSKLPPEEISALTRWIKQGAYWGVQSRPSAESVAATSEFAPTPATAPGLDTPGEFERRTKYWCFQPLRKVSPPSLDKPSHDWPRNPIDAFLLAAMRRESLSPAPEADRRTLIRRLSFDLIGLPPTPGEIAAFLADGSPDAYERLVDRLLASPRYGERWGRHWLDLARFAETAGHEFDYDIPGAFRYRDYVIRAFNADLPYDRFVIEQVAGDLLTHPRRHPSGGSNESIIGTGFFLLGEGTHSPVDLREEQVRRIDNQIDVFAKTFLALTVGCARCHDHKFDPIRATDYYALAGFFRSSRHQQAFIDPADRNRGIEIKLRELKETVRALLRAAAPHLPEPARNAVRELAADENCAQQASGCGIFESFNGDRFEYWDSDGDAFGNRPSARGDFRLSLGSSDAWLIPVRPGQAHSALLSQRFHGVLRSRSFTIEHRFLHWLVSGQGGRLSVVIDGFEKIRDPIYGGLTLTVNAGDQSRWITQDLGMWLGHRAYLEIADGATTDYRVGQTQVADGDGFLAVDEIRMGDEPQPPATRPTDPAPIRLDELVAKLQAGSSALAERLPSALTQYRCLESAISLPTLALSMRDGTGEDERLMMRGNHSNLGAPVPRRFLEVLGGNVKRITANGSGRLALARRLVDPPSSALLARVLVNRLWMHHFGEGLVKSVDDFGAMGKKPSHPQLLDWLAGEFIAQSWSIKAMHRLIVSSSAYRMRSTLRKEAERLDAANVYLHRMNVRRLEGESIRDALLAVSGRLHEQMFGRGIPPYLSPFMDGRGRPARSGPLDGEGRRSIYLAVRRNFLNPMFAAFDAPVPFSTMGRRNVSNVPAQALALMNDPLVIHLATLWAQRLLGASPGGDSAAERIDALFETGLGRPPTPDESQRCLAFLKRHPGQEQTAWADLCHILINVKEFIFID
jgi:hypothetical protein